MRDPNRLDNFYDTMKLIHKTCFPDYRWGQLMMNFLGWVQNKKGDPFFPEEDRMLEYLKEYAKENGPFFDTINF